MKRGDTIVRDFGDTVRALREQRGFSRRVPAKRAGISDVYLGHVERGTSAPSLKTIDAVAVAFDMAAWGLLARMAGSPQAGQPPPGVNVRTWKRIRREFQIVLERVDDIVAQAAERRE